MFVFNLFKLNFNSKNFSCESNLILYKKGEMISLKYVLDTLSQKKKLNLISNLIINVKNNIFKVFKQGILFNLIIIIIYIIIF